MSKHGAQAKRQATPAEEPEIVEAYVFESAGGGYTVKRVRAIVVEQAAEYGPDYLDVALGWQARQVTRDE